MSLENPLYAFTVRNLSYCKRRIQTTITFCDDNTFKSLKSFFVALFYFYLHNHSVTRTKLWHILLHLCGF